MGAVVVCVPPTPVCVPPTPEVQEEDEWTAAKENKRKRDGRDDQKQCTQLLDYMTLDITDDEREELNRRESLRVRWEAPRCEEPTRRRLLRRLAVSGKQGRQFGGVRRTTNNTTDTAVCAADLGTTLASTAGSNDHMPCMQENKLERTGWSSRGGSDNGVTGHGALNRHNVAHAGIAGGRWP